MNPDGRSQRRRRGAFAVVLSAAAGAALAAAMIPAGVAYVVALAASSGPPPINGYETSFFHQTGSGLNPSDISSLQTADEKLTDGFLTQLGPTGLANSFETQLDNGLNTDFSGITPGTLAGLDSEFTIFVGDYGLPAVDVTTMTNVLDTLQADGLSAPLLSGLEGDLTSIFQDLLPAVISSG
jgi:hypothetical protein